MKRRVSFRRSVLLFTAFYSICIFVLTMGILACLACSYAGQKLKSSLTAAVYTAAAELENGTSPRELSKVYGSAVEISILDADAQYLCGRQPEDLEGTAPDVSGLHTVKGNHRNYYVLDLQTKDLSGNTYYIRGCTDRTAFFCDLYFSSLSCDLSGNYANLILETREMAAKCSSIADPKKIPSEMLWYSKGICFSLYDSNANFLCGKLPQGFRDSPLNTSGPVFQNEWNRSYISYDVPVTLQNGEKIYLRGATHFAEFAKAVQMTFRTAFLLIPLLILLLILLLQGMLARALRPVSAVIAQTRQITGGKDLSRRVQITEQSEEFQDLTDTVNAMLERLQDSFLQEERFTSDAAHELRNPLAVILSQSEYLLEEGEISDDVRSSVKVIYDHTSYLGHLISILLQLSRMENDSYPLEPESIDLCLLVKSVIEEAQNAADEKKITMYLECPETEIRMTGDMTLLIQMISNLLQNAIKYGKENGWVKITLQQEKEEILLQVEDNGIGIAPEDCRHIFCRFYRADPSRSQPGYGLGLNLVQWAVRLHHGEISVDSRPEQGSTFTVRLPQNPEGQKITLSNENAAGPLL